MSTLRNWLADTLGVEAGFLSLLVLIFWLGWNTNSLYELSKQVPRNHEIAKQNTHRIETIRSNYEGLREDFRVYACSDRELPEIARKRLDCGRYN